MPKKVVIIGASGRDFHDFNVCFRGKKEYRVVAFTQAVGQNIAWSRKDLGKEGFVNRRYPPKLAGKLYPRGIPIYPEEMLYDVIRRYKADMAVFSYSDVSCTHLFRLASITNAAGADFVLLSPDRTMIRSKKPVIAITASRTGAGKSTVSRYVVRLLKKKKVRVAAVRHPMPYGNLEEEIVQRFATYEDLDRHKCTLEEREEYEPHIDAGNVIFAGVDYGRILRRAEKEGDVVLWDGGNNDMPFYRPDLHITVIDPYRPGDEHTYHPGATCVRTADLVVINKIDTAPEENVRRVRDAVKEMNPDAAIVLAESPVAADDPKMIRGKRVLVVEDGPTVTHGERPGAAGLVAAEMYRAKEIIDPRPYAVGNLRRTYQIHPHIGPVMPTMGYGMHQIKELERVIAKIDCDTVVLGTPIDLRRVMKIKQPVVRIRYELKPRGRALDRAVYDFLKR